MKRKIDIMSDEELLSIWKNLNKWKWDERLGKKPFMYDKLNNYKKPNNVKFRLELLFRAVWPFTKEYFIKPLLNEVKKRDLKVPTHFPDIPIQ